MFEEPRETTEIPQPDKSEASLDPIDWNAFRATAHQALDDAITFLETVRDRPVWQPVPDHVQTALFHDAPAEGQALDDVYRQFQELILPYATGNIHPRFFGWVHGTGQAGGIVSEMLAAAMNANCGGRDHGAIYVERAVLNWCKQIFSFPVEASGLLVSGTSIANLIALGVARSSLPDSSIRQEGLKNHAQRLVAYTSSEAHDSVRKAVEILGLGASSLRSIAVDENFRIDTGALRKAIAEDRRTGLQPFCVVGSAGTVNTGAIDDLEELASICQAESLWFHVDGAFGALGVLSEQLRSRLRGIERADSLAFDFHKWMFVQYDAGCILVRRGDLHKASYTTRPPYLRRQLRGLAAGEDWPCEFGPELSRSFRALKVWFALKEHGLRTFGRIIDQNCSQAQYVAKQIETEPCFELLAPVALNVVCFRYHLPDWPAERLDQLNEDIVVGLHESGIAAPSTTKVCRSTAIRLAITNHRSRREDFDILLQAVLQIGQDIVAGKTNH